MNALLLALALSASTASTPVQTTKPTVTATKWVCGAPQALENDAVQTVRICSTK